MQILGHSQISLTLGTYSHVVPELAQEAAQRLGDALSGQKATTLAPRPAGAQGPAKQPASLTVGRVGLEPTTYGL